MNSISISSINGNSNGMAPPLPPPPPESLILERCPPNAAAAAAAYGWLSSPRISFSHDDDHQQLKTHIPKSMQETHDEEDEDDIVLDFEFRLNDPVTMLPADELFSDGKLVPLHLRPPPGTGSPPPQKLRVEAAASALADPYAFSPRAPVRCTARWRELLGLKKARQQQQDRHHVQPCSKSPNPPSSAASTTPATTNTTVSNRKTNGVLRHYLLHRSSRSNSGESFSSSEWSESLSRLSLSSSSSSSAPDHEDLPRLSLDSERAPPPKLRISNPKTGRTGRGRVRAMSPRGSSVDSPRMNSYGRIVFQSLERSSSSPSSFGAAKTKLLPHRHRGGMERSYSANVCIAPVLNVPVCSIRVSSSTSKSSSVFGFLSPQKKDSSSPSPAATRRGC